MIFNEADFLNGTTDGAFDTKRIPIPQGEYTALIKDVKPRVNVQGKKDPTKSYNFLDYALSVVLTPEAQAIMETVEVEAKRNYSLIIELDESGTRLASGKGKNVDLGKFREAIGQNEDGKPWGPRMPVGKMVKVLVTHRTLDTGDIVDQIDKISAI